jgi:hypothetical protein
LPLDDLARRVRLWLGLAVFLVTTVAAAGTWAVSKMTSDVREQLLDTHADLVALTAAQAARAAADSIRFERAMEVLELAVGAIVEPDGSTEQKQAIAELRRRRHVAP